MNVGELIEELWKYDDKTNINVVVDVPYLNKCFCCYNMKIATVTVGTSDGNVMWLEICAECDRQNTVPLEYNNYTKK